MENPLEHSEINQDSNTEEKRKQAIEESKNLWELIINISRIRDVSVLVNHLSRHLKDHDLTLHDLEICEEDVKKIIRRSKQSSSKSTQQHIQHI